MLAPSSQKISLPVAMNRRRVVDLVKRLGREGQLDGMAPLAEALVQEFADVCYAFEQEQSGSEPPREE